MTPIRERLPGEELLWHVATQKWHVQCHYSDVQLYICHISMLALPASTLQMLNRRHKNLFAPIREPFMKRKALALLSGGLDSTLAVKIMLDMGIEVEALNFTSPFCSCTGKNSGCKSEAVRVANEFNIPIKVMHKGLDYLDLIRNPPHGHGKGLNPCIDCRIYLLKKAKEYMPESGADFVITGEVIGQRPMSQRRDTLRVIERESGLEGLLLRPLSALHFEETIPEKEGWVDRTKLLSITGRSRQMQMQLADELDVKNYPCPGGGCLLTEPSFIPKIKDIFDHTLTPDLRDFTLLKIGRHYRIAGQSKLIIGRNEQTNDLLETVRHQEEAALTWLDGNTPLGVVTGLQDESITRLAARILLRYTKAEAGVTCRIRLRQNGEERIITACNDLNAEAVETYQIA